MVGMGSGLSQDHILQELVEKAIQLWGPQRVEALRPVLEVTAQNLWRVANNLPSAEQQPAFFSKE